MLGVVESRRYPKTEEIRGMKVRVVQGIDIGTKCFSKDEGQCSFIFYGGDGVQVRL